MLRKKVKEKELFIIQLLEKISFLECEVRHYLLHLHYCDYFMKPNKI